MAEVNVTGSYPSLYDQAGLMIRSDETTWMKCGIEFVDDRQYASVVVTRDCSDWSVIPLSHAPSSCCRRVTRKAGDVDIHYSLDGNHYTLLRIAHLSMAKFLHVGVLCATPEGPGFSGVFESFVVRTIDQPQHETLRETCGRRTTHCSGHVCTWRQLAMIVCSSRVAGAC